MADPIVAGSEARTLEVKLVTTDTPPVAIQPTSARLQGRSEQLPLSPIDVAMVVGAAPDYVCTVDDYGSLVTPAILGTRESATYTFEVYYVVNGEPDYSPRFVREFVRPLVNPS